MVRAARRTRGGKPSYVIGRDGRPIVGLSYDKTLNQHYATHQRPKKYFGADFDQAVVRFRIWESERTKSVVAIHTPPHNGAIQVQLPLPESWSGPVYVARASGGFHKLPAAFLPELKGATERGLYTLVESDAFYAKCRELIQKDRTKFAERVGIPQIAWLNELEPPGPSLTVEQAGALYFGKRKKVSAPWRHKQERFWKEFQAATGAKPIREITSDDVARYHDVVWDAHENHERSATYVAHRFQAVRTILRHALKRGRDQQQLRRVLDLCQVFETPPKSGTDPRPIAREDFQKLLGVSSAKWKAIFTLAMNGAFYPSEVAAVKNAHIDWDAKTLVMDRGKTGVPRIAVLWDRTIEALREYQREERHDSEYVFVSATGLPYDGTHVSRNFRRRRAEAGLDESVTFDMIRDGAYTAAVDGGADITQAKMLAGHRAGIADAYLKRNPHMVTEACAAIEHKYFGVA